METTIEKNVMRRVRRIHTLRPFISGFAASCVLLLLALWGIGREVWVAHVFQNMPHSGGIMPVLNFYFAAFLNTRITVQMLSVATLGSVFWLARETAKLLSYTFTLGYRRI
ncbi:MAG TPA: hypothetical protein VM103_00990 [Candidatus Paceibacterota bacterium]|nr:hypothetical protein [Candidatus Paceibacterota bacterium]